jgi:hypothetical protein
MCRVSLAALSDKWHAEIAGHTWRIRIGLPPRRGLSCTSSAGIYYSFRRSLTGLRKPNPTLSAAWMKLLG